MPGLAEFEEVCRNLVWKWELIEDDTAREAGRVAFEDMMAKYQALRLEVANSAPDSTKVSVTEMKKIEDVYRRYAPAGFEA